MYYQTDGGGGKQPIRCVNQSKDANQRIRDSASRSQAYREQSCTFCGRCWRWWVETENARAGGIRAQVFGHNGIQKAPGGLSPRAHRKPFGPPEFGQNHLPPRVGLEPTTTRLTAGCSTIELSGTRDAGPRTTGGVMSSTVVYPDLPECQRCRRRRWVAFGAGGRPLRPLRRRSARLGSLSAASAGGRLVVGATMRSTARPSAGAAARRPGEPSGRERKRLLGPAVRLWGGAGGLTASADVVARGVRQPADALITT